MDDKKTLKPDGKIHPIGDAMEAHSDFQEEYDLMCDDFFKKENPGYYNLIQRLKKQNGIKTEDAV
jgi:hypothetical protein